MRHLFTQVRNALFYKMDKKQMTANACISVPYAGNNSLTKHKTKPTSKILAKITYLLHSLTKQKTKVTLIT